ncbi:MAG: hypothetical protein ACRENG_01815, partial [bacterium]
SGQCMRREQRQAYNQREIIWQAMMLTRKKTGDAKLLAALKNGWLHLRLRKSKIIVSSTVPIMLMREIGSDVGDEQERGKKQYRDFSDSL